MAAPHDDTSDLVETFLATLTTLRDLAGGLTDEQWELPTGCVGWTVRDHLSHVVGLEFDLADRSDGEVPLPALPHLTEGNRAMEHSVEKRRTWSPERILSEYDEIAAARSTALRSLIGPGFDPTAPIRGPFGWELPLRPLLGLRIFDVYAHELDIRRAVGKPGGLETAAFTVSRRRIAGGLAATLPTAAPEIAGSTIALTVTGLAEGNSTLVIDLREPKPRVVAGAFEGDPTVTLTMEAGNFIALGCGRTDADLAAVTITGDLSLGDAVLANFGVTP